MNCLVGNDDPKTCTSLKETQTNGGVCLYTLVQVCWEIRQFM